jgi:ribonuclease P protein component
MAHGAARLRRTDRLRNSKDFQRISRQGGRRASAHFVVIVGKQWREEAERRPLLGITVSKKVGTAVERNRVKRRIREWFRQNREHVASDEAVVVIARRGAAELDVETCERELGSLVP